MVWRKIIRFFLVFTFLFSIGELKAQTRIIMDLSVIHKKHKLSDVEIGVYKSDTLIKTTHTNGRGQLEVQMELDSDYSIDVGGNNGLVKKRLSINTPKSLVTENAEDFHFPAEIDLFKKSALRGTSIVEPIEIGKIVFNPNGEFEIE